jgi:formylglycine-generating enzyme required for sulfatase activity
MNMHSMVDILLVVAVLTVATSGCGKGTLPTLAPTGLSTPIDLVEIPPGEFLMGSPEDEEERGGWETDETLHPVRISYAFKMGKFEVTQKQWREVMGSTIQQQRDEEQKRYVPPTLWECIMRADPKGVWAGVKRMVVGDEPWPLSGEGDDYPIYFVSCDEAMEFCVRLTELEQLAGRLPMGQEYRLPTEAEWEYACRAGSTTRFANGDAEADLDALGWYANNSGNTTHPVGMKRPNAWGLYDMHGNIGEWCQDWYGEYPLDSVTNPAGPPFRGGVRVSRSGCAYSVSRFCRAAYREGNVADMRANGLGFRVLLGPSISPSLFSRPMSLQPRNTHPRFRRD